MKRTFHPRRRSLRFSVQQLEDRTTPADYTLLAPNTLGITLNNLGEAISLTATTAGFSVVGSVAATATGGDVAGVSRSGNNASVVLATLPITAVQINATASSTTVHFVDSGSTPYKTAITILDTGTAIDAVTFAGATSIVAATGGAGDFSGEANTISTVPTAVPTSLSAVGDLDLTAVAGGAHLPANLVAGGAVSVAANGSIYQDSSPNMGIVASSGATFTIDIAVNQTIELPNADNSVVGAVAFNQTGGGTISDITWRNKASLASTPTFGVGVAPQNYTLDFENASVALPAMSVGSSIDVTAFGDITQTGTLSGPTASGSFTVLGNSSIVLNNAANTLASARFSASHSTKSVSFGGASDLSLGSCDLGRASFAVTVLGSISESAPINQLPAGGDVKFKVLAATNAIDVSTQNNYFTGNVVFDGVPTAVSVNNAAPTADFDRYVFPSTTTSLTIVQSAAPVVLGTFPSAVAQLYVTGLGIYQKVGVPVVMPAGGYVMLDARDGEIALTNPGNHFERVALDNSSRNNIAIVDKASLALAKSFVSAGRLSITVGKAGAGGDLTQTGHLATDPDTIASFATTGAVGNVTLSDTGNRIRGRVDLSTQGTATVVTNTGGLLLGNVTTAPASSLTLNDPIVVNALKQAPGTALNVGGTLTVNGFTLIDLSNPNNVFGGTVSETAGAAVSQTYRTAGAITFGNINATDLNVFANGAIGEVSGASIVSTTTAAFDAGTGDITLAEAGNNFNVLSARTRGNLNVRDANALTLGNLNLGAGAVTIAAAGPVAQQYGSAIIQDAPLATSFGPFSVNAATSAVTLNGSRNEIQSKFAFLGSGDVALANRGSIVFGSSTWTFGPTANLNLTAGATIDLSSYPSGVLSAGNIQLNASTIKDKFNLTSTGSIAINGSTFFDLGTTSRNITLTAPTGVTFVGNVDMYGLETNQLNFTAPLVRLMRGVWDQAMHNLTMNSPGTTLQIGDPAPGAPDALFTMTSATYVPYKYPTTGQLNLGAGGTMVVNPAGGFAVGDVSNNPETVNVAGDIRFGAGAKLSVGLSNVAGNSDQLLCNGTIDSINPGDQPIFVADGVAGSAYVSAIHAASIASGFQFQRASRTTPAPFYAATDMLQAQYTATDFQVKAGGTVATGGVATGYLSSGDAYTVAASVGQLVVVKRTDPSSGVEGLDIVVRESAPFASLAITVSNFPLGGTGTDIIPIFGIGVINPVAGGSVTIFAPSSDIRQAVAVGNASLAWLNVQDIVPTGSEPVRIASDSPLGGSTYITARDVNGMTFLSNGTLGSLTARQVIETEAPNQFYATSFGTLTTTGSVTEKIAGDFSADIIQVPTATAQNAPPPSPPVLTTRLSSLTVAGALVNTNIDLYGDVGTIRAKKTSNTQIGKSLDRPYGGASTYNPDGLRNVLTLDLGKVASTDVTASGTLWYTTATEWIGGAIRAKNIYMLWTTADIANGTQGDVNAAIVATGNAASSAIAWISIAGDYAADPLTGKGIIARNGNVGTISVVRNLSDGLTVPTTPEGGGSVASITAGSITDFALDARNTGTIAAVGYLPGGIFGLIAASTFNLRGNNGYYGVALAGLTASLDIASSTVNILNGSLTTLSATRNIWSSTNVTLYDPSLGNVGTVRAGAWSNANLVCRTIGTFQTTGLPAAAVKTDPVVGDVASAVVRTFLDDPTKATLGIGTFYDVGNASSASIFAPNGIGTFYVAREMAGTLVVSDSSATAASTFLGRIGSVIAGKISTGSTIDADSIGYVWVTGFLTPEMRRISGTLGSIADSAILAKSYSPATGVGLGTVTVDSDVSNVKFFAPRGSAGLSVGGTLSGVQFDADYVPDGSPILAGYGRISSLAASAIFGSDFLANTIGTITTVPSARFGLDGTVDSSRFVARDANAAMGVWYVTLSGDFQNRSALLAPAKVASISVNGSFFGSTIAAGYGASASIGYARFGELHNATLVSRQIPTVQVVGNAARRLGGGVFGSFVNVFGNLYGVGISSFWARGTLDRAILDVTDGDLTSFTAARLRTSTVQVGAQFTKGNTVDAAAVFGPTVRKIVWFVTTAPYAGNAAPLADQIASASFRDSFVVAGSLGTVTISGQASTSIEKQGVVFKNGSPSGTVWVAGTPVADNTAYSYGIPPTTTKFWKKGN